MPKVERQRIIDINRNKVSHFWIEVALLENKLLIILQYLISNASKYYENESIISDAEYSAILVSLLGMMIIFIREANFFIRKNNLKKTTPILKITTRKVLQPRCWIF